MTTKRSAGLIVALLLASVFVMTQPASSQTRVYTCEGLEATIVGTPDADVITGTDGNDVIVGLAGNDIIHGLGGRDVICGNEGRDRLFGGRSPDRLFGGDNGDKLKGGTGSDQLYGEQGNDLLIGGNGDDLLDGGTGRIDRLSGRVGVDECRDRQLSTWWNTCEGDLKADLWTAINSDLVAASFESIGGASGDIVELEIRRLVENDLEITVEAGLKLENQGGGRQDLVLAYLTGRRVGDGSYIPTSKILLTNDLLREYIIEAFCAEAHEANPATGDNLVLSAPYSAALTAALKSADSRDANLTVTQAGVWVVTDDITEIELSASGYGLNGAEKNEVRAVITAAGLNPDNYRLFG